MKLQYIYYSMGTHSLITFCNKILHNVYLPLFAMSDEGEKCTAVSFLSSD